MNLSKSNIWNQPRKVNFIGPDLVHKPAPPTAFNLPSCFSKILPDVCLHPHFLKVFTRKSWHSFELFMSQEVTSHILLLSGRERNKCHFTLHSYKDGSKGFVFYHVREEGCNPKKLDFHYALQKPQTGDDWLTCDRHDMTLNWALLTGKNQGKISVRTICKRKTG